MRHRTVLRARPPASASTVVLVWLILIVIYSALFTWYASSGVIAHTYPTGHTNFWFGLMHGYFALPSFIISWFNHEITIYQSPNDGFWYNIGFLIGISSFTCAVQSG